MAKLASSKGTSELVLLIPLLQVLPPQASDIDSKRPTKNFQQSFLAKLKSFEQEETSCIQYGCLHTLNDSMFLQDQTVQKLHVELTCYLFSSFFFF